MASDVWVISQKNAPPGVYPTQQLVEQWSAWKTELLAATLFAKLWTNDFTWANTSTLASLIESVAPGYAPIAVTVLDGPDLDPSGNAYMSSPKLHFTCSGGGTDLIYGAVLCKVIGAAASVAFTLTGGQYTLPVITPNVVPYQIPPKITATGATGTGATFTAVLTAGILTGVTINNPGTGYTTVTNTVEAPMEAVDGGNLPAPLPLQSVTDAVDVIFELDNLAA